MFIIEKSLTIFLPFIFIRQVVIIKNIKMTFCLCLFLWKKRVMF